VGSVPAFVPIAGKVQVVDSDPLGIADRHVAEFLDKEKIFAAVVVGAAQNWADLQLVVRAKVKEDDHFGAEICKAILRGILLGLADDAFADDYDYEVRLSAVLRKGNVVLKNYSVLGKYRGSKAESSQEEIDSETRDRAWNHALALLAYQLKKDGGDISAFLEKNRRPVRIQELIQRTPVETPAETPGETPAETPDD
jgi:hypothetical protein